MKSKRFKISLFSGLVIVLVLCIICSEMSFSKSNMNRALTHAEMMRAFGSCDCTHTIPRYDCEDEDCAGCSPHESTGDGWCPDVSNGTGNSRDICDSESTPDGVCKENGNVKCLQYQVCDTDGMWSSNMKCSTVSGNCTNGSEGCVECVTGNVHDWEYKKTYICSWE